MNSTRKRKLLPDAAKLLRFLNYDSESGRLSWKARQPHDFPDSPRLSKEACCKAWNKNFAGKEAFTFTDPLGYRHGSIYRQRFLAHRVIWKMTYDSEPLTIDHIDGNPSNNALKNLRSVEISENQKNQKMNARNTSGVCGVNWHNKARKWAASIRCNGRAVHLGLFSEKHEAAAARIEAQKLLNYDPRHGVPR